MSFVIAYRINCVLECTVSRKMFLNTSCVFSPHVIVVTLLVCSVVWYTKSVKQKTTLFWAKKTNILYRFKKREKHNYFLHVFSPQHLLIGSSSVLEGSNTL